MENKINIWSLNFGFLLSILLHIYVIFFLTGFNLDLFDKKERIVITLSAIGTMDESPKESIKKEKIIKKKIPVIKEIKRIIWFPEYVHLKFSLNYFEMNVQIVCF